MTKKNKKVLVIGGGGREHALCWTLARSPSVAKIYCAPGNAGIGRLAECVPIAVDDIPALAKFAREHAIDLTFVVASIYTLMNHAAEDITDDDERVFVAQLAESLVLAQRARVS